MPITEIPPTPSSPSSPPPEPPLWRRRARYEELDPDELFHVIDDLQGSKTRGRIREFIWVSIIVHMIVFWYLAYGPRYFHHVRVVNQSIDQHKDFTYLDTPETLRKMKPKLPSEHLEVKRPDQKTLEAMRKAEPPKPQPQPPPPAPEVAQQQPPPPVQPVPSNQQALVEAPKPAAKPAPTAPNFNTGPSTPGEAIRQAARAASQAPSITGGQGGPSGPNGPVAGGGAAIISDTMGVDFNAYLKRIVYDTERAWWPIIPEIAQPPLNKQGRVLIRFKILKDGTVKEMHLEGPSGDVSLDRAAWGGILGAAPFPQLPKDFKGDFIELRFYFLYNIKPGAE